MAHAVLSPSAASRWLTCTRSARLEEQFPDSAGDAAKEGSLAHELGELLLKMALGRIFEKQYRKELAEIKKNKFYGSEMQRYAEDYRDFVLEQYAETKSQTPDAVLYLEQSVDLTHLVPEGFGTRDCAIIGDGTLTIIDLKYGKGVLVSAVNNKQMMLYALGSLHEFELLYDIQTIKMIIHQPRLDNYSVFEIAVTDLVAWGESDLRPKATLAFAGEGEFVPGDACKFCRAKAQCRALADQNLALAAYEFRSDELLEDHEIPAILDQVDRLVDWANAVKKFAFDQALQGKKWDGYKLVEGRSNHKYTDEDAVAQLILDNGWPESDVFTKKIIGITAMEKLIGKQDMSRMLGDLIEKPPGSPTLVPTTDKRPEYNSALADFSDDFIIH